MGIDTAHYHGWQGTRRTPWLAALAIVRVALLQVFRRRVYWLVLSLGLLHFLLFFALIYAVTQLPLPDQSRRQVLEKLGFAPAAAAVDIGPAGDAATELRSQATGENGYIEFMNNQSIIVMLLLAVSGSLLVGSDYQGGALPFYLSRRIDRLHYIFGKLLAVATLIWIVTVLPALGLFVEYGLFTTSADYWIDNLTIVGGVLGYGLVSGFALSLTLVTLSSYLVRTAPIAIVWSSAFVLLAGLSNLLSEATGNRYWKLLSFWRDVRYTGQMAFDYFGGRSPNALAWPAFWIVCGVCVVMWLALLRRVRAVEVVT